MAEHPINWTVQLADHPLGRKVRVIIGDKSASLPLSFDPSDAYELATAILAACRDANARLIIPRNN